MRVITEEVLIKTRNSLSKKGNVLGACAIDLLIGDHLAEIDQLTVPKLRPMNELKEGDVAMVYSKESDAFFKMRVMDTPEWKSYFEGWIPMPTYKPEQP